MKFGKIAFVIGYSIGAMALARPGLAADTPQQAELRSEVAAKGWIAYSARSKNGSWDLFVSRPDGTSRRVLTDTPDFEEAAPRWSLDGRQLLYRRIAKGTEINHDLWGFQGQLIIANADGSDPVIMGDDQQLPWASWSPDATQLICLNRKGIDIVDIATKNVIRSMPRKGIYQQLFWSADGKWLTGTGNIAGKSWKVVRMNAETGELNPVDAGQSCTPDWCSDSKRVIYSSRPPEQKTNKGYGWTQLWVADGDGQNGSLVYGEEGVHIYGGAMSPDDHYVLFTKCTEDGGGAEKTGGPMFIMRFNDTPAITGESAEMRSIHPNTKDGPAIEFGTGWEPCWTYAEILQGR